MKMKNLRFLSIAIAIGLFAFVQLASSSGSLMAQDGSGVTKLSQKEIDAWEGSTKAPYTLSYYNAPAYYWLIPGSEVNEIGMRFTSTLPFSVLESVGVYYYTPVAVGTPDALVSVYSESGGLPATLLGSVVVPYASILDFPNPTPVDLSSLGLMFGAGEEFFIVLSTIVAVPGDDMPPLSDDGATTLWGRGTYLSTIDGLWYPIAGLYGIDAGFIIDANMNNLEHIWVGGAASFENDWHTASNWLIGTVPTSSDNVLIPSGPTYFPTISAAAVCNSLTVESGASLLDNGNLTASGNITAERAYSGGQWHLIGAPLSGAVSGMFNGLYLQSHDEVSNTYSDIIGTSNPLTSGQGFALWNPSSSTASYSGTIPSSATSGLTRSAAGNTRGWNLVSNPFPSSIDWEATSGWSKTNVAASTYCFDGAGSGNWAVWNGTTGTNGATQNIASGQGFFVSVPDGNTTGTLGFGNGVRVHDNTAFFKDEPTDIVKLKVSGNGFSDETAIYFRDEATVGFDEQMDAHSLPSFNETAPYIYSVANDGMAINVLPEVASVNMNVKSGVETGAFTIETVKNGEFNELFLEDLATGIVTDLNAGSYTFDYVSGMESRFVLHFGTMAVDNNLSDLFEVYSFDKDVYVEVPSNTTGTISIYNITGQEIVNIAINQTMNKITLDKSAYYLVKVQSESSVVTKKIFIK